MDASLRRAVIFSYAFAFVNRNAWLAALDRGWIPKGNLHDPKLYDACRREDDGEYKCIVKRGQLDRNIIGALEYVFNANGTMDSPESQAILQLSGPDLENAARSVISDYFDAHRHEGVTCDFGGIAMLSEANRTLTDDDAYSFTDDSYTIVNKGPAVSDDCRHSLTVDH
jgi:hypothetical protein